jgi:hypothetical protein
MMHFTMVAQPSLALMNLVTETLGTLLYGMYCIIFATSMYFLLVNTRGPAKYLPVFRSVIFVSGCGLWLSITTVSPAYLPSGLVPFVHPRPSTQHWITTVVTIFQGFIYFGDRQDTNIYFNDNGRLTETLGNVFLMLSLVIGDAMIVRFPLITPCTFREKNFFLYRFTVSGLSGLTINSL